MVILKNHESEGMMRNATISHNKNTGKCETHYKTQKISPLKMIIYIITAIMFLGTTKTNAATIHLEYRAGSPGSM